MNKLIKDERGFTLLDTMVSIGIFAVLCIFIAQIAIYTANSNKKSRELDTASTLAMNAIEEFKALKSVNEFFDSDFFYGTEINIGEDYALFNKDRLASAEFDSTIIIYKFYNKDFEHLPNIFEENPSLEIENEEIKYIQYFYLYSKTDIDGFTFIESGQNLDSSGNMFNIQTYITKVDENEQSQLVSYATKKYFVNKG